MRDRTDRGIYSTNGHFFNVEEKQHRAQNDKSLELVILLPSRMFIDFIFEGARNFESKKFVVFLLRKRERKKRGKKQKVVCWNLRDVP